MHLNCCEWKRFICSRKHVGASEQHFLILHRAVASGGPSKRLLDRVTACVLRWKIIGLSTWCSLPRSTPRINCSSHPHAVPESVDLVGSMAFSTQPIQDEWCSIEKCYSGALTYFLEWRNQCKTKKIQQVFQFQVDFHGMHINNKHKKKTICSGSQWFWYYI